MCHPATCRSCGKVTWRGCGMHVNQVMAGVPEEDRCPGHERAGLLAGLFRGRRAD